MIRLWCDHDGCNYEVCYPDWFLPVLQQGAKTNGIGGYQCPSCHKIKLRVSKTGVHPKEEASA